MVWFLKAANLGNTEAQYQLGIMYSNGQGVTASGSNAEKWLTPLATQGHTGAQYQLGLLYRDGVTQDDFPKAPTLAMTWFLKAADKGHKPSLFNIGCMYRDDQGVPQDFYQAMEYFRKATGDDDQGGGVAEAAIGRLYMKGQGVFHNKTKALEWFSKAAEQGNQGALDTVTLLQREIRRIPTRSKKSSLKFW
jgi:TPR repeat protein